MNRRHFLSLASGLLVPEWLLDPPKGRSMVSVPDLGVTFYPRVAHDFEIGLGLSPVIEPIFGRYRPIYKVDGREVTEAEYDRSLYAAFARTDPFTLEDWRNGLGPMLVVSPEVQP
jgi:hypothetical protein